MGRTVQRPPVKPRRMSKRAYRERYDSSPVLVVGPGIRIRCCGAVSGYVVADSYTGMGLDVWGEDAAIPSPRSAQPARHVPGATR
jgi:hypothetical protein